MDIFNFDINDILSFYLTLFRISIILFLLPFFGGRSLPMPVKASLLIILTLAVWPKLSFPAELMPGNLFNVLIMFLGEVVMGMIMSMMVQFLFAAVQTGGHIIGFQMGFAMVNVVDPVTGVSEAVTAHFLYMCTMLTFIVINGPLHLIQGLAHSFELVPPGSLFLGPDLTLTIIDFSKQLFIMAIKIAAPVMGAVFLVDLSLALISRAAPQMHVLLIGFPVKIGVGFFFLGFIFTIMSNYTQDYVNGLGPLFINIFKLLNPG